MSSGHRRNYTLVPSVLHHPDRRCVGVDPELFFPRDGESFGERIARQAAAIAVCSGCPIAVQCREYALAAGEHGIWGGTTEEDRARERRRRARARARGRREAA